MTTPRRVSHLITTLKPEALGILLAVHRRILRTFSRIVVLPAFPRGVVDQGFCGALAKRVTRNPNGKITEVVGAACRAVLVGVEGLVAGRAGRKVGFTSF